ncbi:ATP-binding cassette domain-containing protein [Paraliobacillus sp. JSM ZJ581]|uniref:ABC transporter ATP-binding protein n=1 Tax=Paraliobacillus sp. JSM ZJ581 TaxID=3342118 RepID=UPI0035A906DD
MIETEALQKKFKNQLVVDGINIYIEKGESVGLLGPNGAGKSTTISMISSLIKPTEGDVRLNGKSVVKHPQLIRNVLGVVPQEIALYEELSAYENLKFFGKIYGIRGKQLEDKIDKVLRMVGLKERKKDVVKTYSGGMKRRINIAVALLHEPEILIMDEPTVGIDPQSRNYILEMVQRLNEENGLTILYTSHYMEEVEKLCDRVYIMDHGKIIASGTKKELKRVLSNEETILIETHSSSPSLMEALAKDKDILQASETDKGIKLIVPKDSNKLASIFHQTEAFGIQVTNVTVQIPTLEDVFLHLTGRTLRD